MKAKAGAYPFQPGTRMCQPGLDLTFNLMI